MNDFLNKIVGELEDKKEWKAMEARAQALPEDYRIAYDEIKDYLWNTSGVATLNPFRVLLDRFEKGAANGEQVLDIIGDDVVAFADDLVRDEEPYVEDWREKMKHKLSSNIENKLKK